MSARCPRGSVLQYKVVYGNVRGMSAGLVCVSSKFKVFGSLDLAAGAPTSRRAISRTQEQARESARLPSRAPHQDFARTYREIYSKVKPVAGLCVKTYNVLHFFFRLRFPVPLSPLLRICTIWPVRDVSPLSHLFSVHGALNFRGC